MDTPTKTHHEPAGAGHKNETPPTSGMVNGANSNQTNRILSHAKRALLAIFFSPVYQTAIAGIAAAGLAVWGAWK
jgi:hypothetical protein